VPCRITGRVSAVRRRCRGGAAGELLAARAREERSVSVPPAVMDRALATAYQAPESARRALDALAARERA
jgi:hypothetical protein